METTPSIPIPIDFKPAKDDAHAHVAVAVENHVAQFNELSHGMLFRALGSGLERAKITPSFSGGFHRTNFSSHLVTVARSDRNAAVAVLKATLDELGLLYYSTIASYTDDQAWVVVEGLLKVEIGYDKMFLRNEDIIAAKERSKTFSEYMEQQLEEARKLLPPPENPS